MSVITRPTAKSVNPAAGPAIAEYATGSDAELNAFGIREFVNGQTVTVAPRVA